MQPSCGQPINPGTGNMWHTERDYAGVVNTEKLSLPRTYNSSPYNWDAGVMRGFGTRWTSPYDAVLKAEPAPKPEGPSICWRREDTGYVWCAGPIDPQASVIPAAVSIVRSDGKKYLFNRSGTTWVSDADVNDRITATFNADNSAIVGWAYVSAQGDATETYDANGLLTTIAARNGAVQRLTYSDGITNDSSAGRVPVGAPVCSHVQAGAVLPTGRLLCVTDNWGRQLQFEYDGKGRIAKMIDPANQSYLYAYDGPSGGCAVADADNRACAANNLTQVTYPGGKSRTYYYNEAAQINGGAACTGPVIGNGFGNLLNAWTSLVDENGARHISWTYDCLGRATSSQVGAGAEKVVLAYGEWLDGATTTTVTHYLGTITNPQTTVRSYSYQTILGVAKNLSINQPCVECGDTASRVYDANGNITSRTDWNGSKTTYVYDLTRNLGTTRTEAFGTAQARTITTAWHPSYRLPAKIAEPKKLTTFAYDANGNLLTKTAQATTDATGAAGLSATVTGAVRKWTYTYNSLGQVLTATGPRTNLNDTTTYTYDNQGNMITVKDAAGLVTTLSNYDANGRVGRIVDANGLTTNLTYSPRGWLTSKNIGGEITTYDYDGVGQMTKITQPDGSVVNYTYDDAHRLTAIADSTGNKIVYTLDAMGNRIKEEIKDPTGNLARQTTRVYDALNRLQQVTGGAQ